jgi:hypothetical protein
MVPNFDGYLSVGSKLAGAPGYFGAGPAAIKEREERARIYAKIVINVQYRLANTIDKGVAPHDLSEHDANL